MRPVAQPGLKRLRDAEQAAGPFHEARLGWADDFPDRFEVLDKVGEGSFGTVWTAKEHDKEASEPLLALKRINLTCSPSRILNEFEQMRKLGGVQNVIEVKGIVRTPGGSFAIVMPFFQHDEFSDYINTLTLSGIAAYMRSLLTALSHVHSEGVVHRDIKPRNFMYHVESRQGMLIDFGLAEPAHKWKGRAHALAKYRDGKRARGEKTLSASNITRNDAGRRAAVDEPSFEEARTKRTPAGATPPPRNVADGERGMPIDVGDGSSGDNETSARLLRKVERAGTSGFRAPEILWHSRDQGPAVDVWSAGVILLCLLSRRYPLFPSADNDEMAMVQIAALCGVEQLKRAARASGRCDVSEFPSIKRATIAALCSPLLGGVACDEAEERMRFEALNLVTILLRVDPRERCSSRDALVHPFLSDA